VGDDTQAVGAGLGLRRAVGAESPTRRDGGNPASFQDS